MTRKLIGWNLTRDDVPPLAGFNPYGETPIISALADQDLRVQRNGDGARFIRAVIFACQCIEVANPGTVAVMTDHEMDGTGNVSALTITVTNGPTARVLA